VEIGGYYYVDGGLDSGIALEQAKADGFRKFFVVLTRERGYRKEPTRPRNEKFIRIALRKYPFERDAMLTRSIRYNNVLEELEELEKQGRALCVYPNVMPIESTEKNYDRLNECYYLGYRQGRQDLPRWKEFLGM
jgi:predicted patatin/cPLA2 family phospholipase